MGVPGCVWALGRWPVASGCPAGPGDACCHGDNATSPGWWGRGSPRLGGDGVGWVGTRGVTPGAWWSPHGCHGCHPHTLVMCPTRGRGRRAWLRTRAVTRSPAKTRTRRTLHPLGPVSLNGVAPEQPVPVPVPLTPASPQHYLTEIEVLAIIFAAAIHDYEHTGTTNSFHIQTK